MLLQDFQFFNTARLTEIFDKEQNYEVFKHTQAQKEQAARAQVRTNATPFGARQAHVIAQCLCKGLSALAPNRLYFGGLQCKAAV